MRLKVCESKEDWHNQLNEFSHDFYHTWDYHQTSIEEGQVARLFVVIADDGGKLAFPLIERSTNLDGKKDLLGGYGYSGPLFNNSDKKNHEKLIGYLFEQLQSLDYVSLFSRTHPTLNCAKLGCMEDCGEVVVAEVGNGIDELYSTMRKDHKRDIRKLKNSDFILKITTSPSESELDSFIRVYEETMRHLSAAENYYFPRSYYASFFDSTEFTTYMISVEDPNTREVVASAMMVNCCDIFQYHLSGTLPHFYPKYPMKLILGVALELAFDKGASIFVLGGGVGGKRDSLFDFKYGFTKKSVPFRTIARVLDKDSYDKLVEMKSLELSILKSELYKSSYFPAYRNDSLC